ncbi:MAG: SpoIIIAH-like family protein [Clostridia bacterium]|nr:SpoIIIAH-like family protein [Clostridia bacterium]
MKEKLKKLGEKIKEKTAGFRKRAGKKTVAIVCAVVLAAGVLAVNLALLGGDKKDEKKGAEKTSLAIDLTKIGESGAPAESEEPEDAEKTSADDYLATVSLGRQQARDEAMEVLLAVSESEDALPDAKADAMNDMNRIALDIEREAQIETLVVSRGFKDCVAVLNGDKASVIVESEPLTPGQVAQVSEIVYEIAGILPVNLKIIEKTAG